MLDAKIRQAPLISAEVYVHHRPETKLLYQIVQEYWSEFQAELASNDQSTVHRLPLYRHTSDTKVGFTKPMAQIGVVTLEL